MGNDSRSSRKSKDDESSSSKNKLVNGKGSPSLGSGTADTSVLRRSTRETSSRRQMGSSPSNMRKSDRLEKRTPTPPPVKKKSEIVENKSTPSPLRRSDRGKKHNSPSSLGSKKSENGLSSSDMKQKKGKTLKIVKRLIIEARKVSTSERSDTKPVNRKRKRMVGRAYKALFQKQRKSDTAADEGEELEGPSKLSQVDSSSGEDSGSEQAEDREDGGHDISSKTGEELREGVEGASEDDSDSEGKSSEASATIASKDMYTSSTNAISSPSSGCKMRDDIETCVSCSKRRRVEHDSQDDDLCSCNLTLNKGLCGTSAPKDRGELEAGAVTGLAENCDNIKQHNKTSLDVQMDVNQNICIICKIGGKLMCCDGKGCKRSFHISCLDPPLSDVPPGVWHCIWCVKKKIETGVHTVSKGVESIWDSRESKVLDAGGLQMEKEYFVKYTGLAHIHNQWVLEKQLLREAPLLVTNFNQQDQVVKWNEEWTVPHRLLLKRPLKFPKQQNENHGERDGENFSCYCEWLVRWRGLSYEHATWELENASFLGSTNGQNLIRDYENRRKRANAADKSKTESPIKLSKLPAGSPPGIDNNHLNTVNRLREYWHKGQSAAVFDVRERVMNVILYVLSLSNVDKPFLIITTSDLLSHWETEFLRLVPSIDVVVYAGDRDTRKSIRTLEFYEERGQIIFQVLLSSLEAVVEDEKILASLRWAAVIVDECQCSKVSTRFGKIKELAADVRVLLFNAPIKESIAEYLNILSLLDCRADLAKSDALKSESNDKLGKLKERLSQYVAYDCKSDSPRFAEFWVPAQISNVQLEQYCATLLSNSISLCSCPKNDPVGVLRDILISSRKCCNHPYLVDQSLQGLLTKDLPEIEYLDVGIKASGKLQLLDAMLLELKNRKLRVVILFQSIGGSGRDSIGDILDDFIRQRFGPDSYERVDGGIIPSKKQAALNRFNKDSGRFVFLLENRACLPSIKLLSVDTIIIFDSDWNLANDLRSLNKISIDSQFEQIKFFRLYTSCTVEEKVLVLAKNNVTLDSNCQNINQSNSDALLMWGASYLFNKLDEFHSGSVANISSEQSVLDNVVKEFSAVLSQNGKVNDASKSMILKVQLSECGYNTSVPLLGELKVQLSDKEQPRVFWTKLLEGRNPQWKYSSGQTQRHRKRVQYYDNSPDKQETETNGAGKKRKKIAHIMDSPTLKPRVEGGEVSGFKGGASGIHVDNGSQSLPRSNSKPLLSNDNSSLADSQKSLYLLLKPEISRLCELLKLSEDIKGMIRRFLEYVIENHNVNREPETILQAFLISLCWIGASLLKHKIDRKESLALAKLHLNFICKEEEADSVYSKLRLLKKEFLSSNENIKKSHITQDSKSTAEDTAKEPPIIAISLQRKCEKRMSKLLRKQQDDIQGFFRSWEEKRLQLEKEHRLESALVREIHSHIPVRKEKLKILDESYTKKLEEHKRQKDICLKDLQAKQLGARNDERQKAAQRLAEVKSSENQVRSSHAESESDIVPDVAVGSGGPTGTPNGQASPRSENDEMGPTEQEKASHVRTDQPNKVVSSGDGSEKVVSTSLPCSGKHIPVPIISSVQGEEIQSELPETVFIRDTGTGTPAVESNRGNDRTYEIRTDAPNAVRNQNDGTNSSISGGPQPSLEPSSVVSLACDPSLLQSQVLQNQCSQPVASTDMQDECAPVLGNQSSSQQVEIPVLPPVDAGQTDPSNLEVPAVESLEQMSQSQHINPPLGRNQLDLRTPSGRAHEVNPARSTSFVQQVVEDTVQVQNQSFLQPGGNLSINNGSGNLPQVASRMGPLPLYTDPLQNELDRIRRETDQTIKVHEETKMQLKFQREKEIEEMVAQIRRKYELKLQEAETAFRLKKTELETNHNKVVMNKILAEAFRSKCQDLKSSSGAFGMQQASPSSMQHLRQSQQSQPAARPSAGNGLSSASQPVPSPTVTHQLTPPPLQIVHQSASLLSNPPRPPPLNISSPITPSPSIFSNNTPRPPPPNISCPITPSSSLFSSNTPRPPPNISPSPAHQSASLFSSNPPRPPPNISPITPSPAGNPRGGGGDIRAPAPHIQPFRPPSLHCVMPGQQPLTSLPTTSPSVPQPPPQPSLPLPPPSLPPSLPPLPTNRSPFSTGGPPTDINASLSVFASVLLSDMDNRANNAHRQNVLSPLQDIFSNFNSLDISAGNIPVGSAPSGVETTTVTATATATATATDVVCLSDDD